MKKRILNDIIFYSDTDKLLMKRKSAELLFQAWIAMGNKRTRGIKVPTYKEIIKYIKINKVKSVKIISNSNYFTAKINMS